MFYESLFDQKFGGAWYVPDNSEDSSDWYSFTKMKELCEDEWQTDKTLQEKFSCSDDLLEYMIEFIDWEFPSTFIENLKNFD